jgi:WD40 repeat protein
MVACLWQAHPEYNNAEIMDAVRQSASQYNNPDTLLGYGIPDYLKADSLLSVPVTTEITMDIRVFLEGPYDGNVMNNGLLEVLPTSQPYDVPPFDYYGDEQVSSIPGDDIVDWILVELRNASDPSQADTGTIIARKAAFLKQDGTVTDTSGTNLLTFNVPVDGNLFIVINHRNHLAVMSSEAVVPTGKEIKIWDFKKKKTLVLAGHTDCVNCCAFNSDYYQSF